MYRTKEDKRTKRSIAKITQSLTECLEKKHLSEISVAEIASGAGVSRATFYRIFDTPVDVLACLCDSIADELESKFKSVEPKSQDELRLFVLSFLIGHADGLKAIFRAGRMDLLEKAITPRTHLLVKNALQGLTEREIDYVRFSMGAVLMAILYVWYEHDCKETADDLLAIFNKVVALT